MGTRFPYTGVLEDDEEDADFDAGLTLVPVADIIWRRRVSTLTLDSIRRISVASRSAARARSS